MIKPVALVALLCAVPGQAHAGGLARPNPISARGVSMGGAFTAIADDPTALHFNPAGLALAPSSMVLVGAELVWAPRIYRPALEDGTCDADPTPDACLNQEPDGSIIPLPVLGWVGRLSSEGTPSRLSFGIGLWNSYGGQLSYPEFAQDSFPQLVETQNATIEVVPGIAYEVNDVLAVGAALRLGIGLFHAKTVAKPVTSTLDASGLGVAGTLGVMVRPTPRVNIGLVYRTSLVSKLTGEGLLDISPDPMDIEVQQEWPQSAGAAVAWRAGDRIMVTAQLDWTNWARNNVLRVEFPVEPALNQTFILDWEDNISVRAGGEYRASDQLQLRAGYYFDSNAIPDNTIERQFLDSDKHGVAAGLSYAVTPRWRIDAAIESLLPVGARTVPDNSDLYGDIANPVGSSPGTAANPAPGEHEGKLVTVELAVQYLY